MSTNDTPDGIIAIKIAGFPIIETYYFRYPNHGEAGFGKTIKILDKVELKRGKHERFH